MFISIIRCSYPNLLSLETSLKNLKDTFRDLRTSLSLQDILAPKNLCFKNVQALLLQLKPIEDAMKAICRKNVPQKEHSRLQVLQNGIKELEDLRKFICDKALSYCLMNEYKFKNDHYALRYLDYGYETLIDFINYACEEQSRYIQWSDQLFEESITH